MKNVNGFYGEYGGQFVAETLIPALDELENGFRSFTADPGMMSRLRSYLEDYAGRPTPVYYAKNISDKYGINLYLKREDLLHTGAHKINNTLGQALLTVYMDKKRIIAETGAGQHGVATATAAALFNLDCTVYMGEIDMERQLPNVKKMRYLGADVVPVTYGQKTLKDAVNASLKDWLANIENTHYLLGSVTGPHPFPEMVSFFQSVIGTESREYFSTGKIGLDCIIACVGGGSNAIGMFSSFLEDSNVRLVGVEAGGRSSNKGDHAATLKLGNRGIFQGSLTYLLQDENCQVNDVHSISAGLDYAGVGPQHACLMDTGRVSYVMVSDGETLTAFRELVTKEGIIPALESSHALAYALKNAGSLRNKTILVNLSGRGDKDMGIIEGVDFDEINKKGYLQ